MKALEMKLPKIAVFPLNCNDQYNHLIKRNNASDVSVFPLKKKLLLLDISNKSLKNKAETVHQ